MPGELYGDVRRVIFREGIVGGGNRIPVHDYKCLRVGVVICAILVNTHAHTCARGQLSTGYSSLKGWLFECAYGMRV